MSKGPLAFRTISETADLLDVQQHVLRFWETKFTFIRPTKRAGGRRFYRPQDIALLEGVQTLLHIKGYTIRGVQNLYKSHGQNAILSPNSALPDIAVASPNDQGQPVDIVENIEINTVELRNRDDANQSQKLSQETKEQLMQIARQLEEAQAKLGLSLGRHNNLRKY